MNISPQKELPTESFEFKDEEGKSHILSPKDIYEKYIESKLNETKLLIDENDNTINFTHENLNFILNLFSLYAELQSQPVLKNKKQFIYYNSRYITFIKNDFNKRIFIYSPEQLNDILSKLSLKLNYFNIKNQKYRIYKNEMKFLCHSNIDKISDDERNNTEFNSSFVKKKTRTQEFILNFKQYFEYYNDETFEYIESQERKKLFDYIKNFSFGYQQILFLIGQKGIGKSITLINILKQNKLSRLIYLNLDYLLNINKNN